MKSLLTSLLTLLLTSLLVITTVDETQAAQSESRKKVTVSKDQNQKQLRQKQLKQKQQAKNKQFKQRQLNQKQFNQKQIQPRVISKRSAIMSAQSQVKGKVLSATLIQSRGPAVYRVKMLVSDKRVRTVFVDGQSGRVIRIN